MLHLIAHLYLQPGMESLFREYESEALRVFRAHGGNLIAAFKPERAVAAAAVVLTGAGAEAGPDEIHILSMPSRECFEAWRSSPEVTEAAALRARVVRRTELFISGEPVDY